MQYVEFTREPGKLKLTLLPEAREDIEVGKTQLGDVIEHQLCNGWERVAPEEIGALTDAPIITDDCQRDGDGKLTECGPVYAYMDYQVSDPVAVLAERGFVYLTRHA
jgi:hypothetical protein